MDTEEVPSPVTPGTPGAPLFGGHKGNHQGSENGKRSLLKSCISFNVDDWGTEEGSLSKVSLARKVGAEFIGTLMLIFAGTATAIVNQKIQGTETLIGLAASTGMAVMVVILSTGHISGAHLNPGITIAFAALKHFPWKQVPVYIGAQIVASLCASFALKWIFDPFMGGGVTVPSCGYSQAFALEFIISFNLMFVITAVATDTRAVGELAGIVVGATVMLNVLIAGETTGASMNPVRTLGPAIAANNFRAIWIYLTAPILGTLCGAGIYTAIKLPDQDGDARLPSTARSFRR
ncbi:aquaporin NIP6-1 [Cucurbita maxima]|uniref:Aquaporin NIP6-1 n=1 Tax=Cucurbita maxima TaxID=3661 RepID=A0A6J1KEN1_CUCMA|nr:aquaporin NIP6-1 [Cucurbita maxima]